MTHRTVSFFLSGQPVGKQRARFTKSGHAYTPSKTVDYEKRVKSAAWQAMLVSTGKVLKPTDRRISLKITAFMEIPKSYSISKTLQCQLGIIVPPRPDVDNIIKAVLDGCNGVIYVDDRQVWRVMGQKQYVDEDQEPCLKVRADWFEGDEIT